VNSAGIFAYVNTHTTQESNSHMRIRANTRAYTHTHARAHTHTHKLSLSLSLSHTRTHNMHNHAHTHTHTYKHTNTRKVLHLRNLPEECTEQDIKSIARAHGDGDVPRHVSYTVPVVPIHSILHGWSAVHVQCFRSCTRPETNSFSSCRVLFLSRKHQAFVE